MPVDNRTMVQIDLALALQPNFKAKLKQKAWLIDDVMRITKTVIAELPQHGYTDRQALITNFKNRLIDRFSSFNVVILPSQTHVAQTILTQLIRALTTDFNHFIDWHDLLNLNDKINASSRQLILNAFDAYFTGQTVQLDKFMYYRSGITSSLATMKQKLIPVLY